MFANINIFFFIAFAITAQLAVSQSQDFPMFKEGPLYILETYNTTANGMKTDHEVHMAADGDALQIERILNQYQKALETGEPVEYPRFPKESLYTIPYDLYDYVLNMMKIFMSEERHAQLSKINHTLVNTDW